MKKYMNADGKEVSLERLVREEPLWAVNRIRFMEKQIIKLKETLANIEAKVCNILETVPLEEEEIPEILE